MSVVPRLPGPWLSSGSQPVLRPHTASGSPQPAGVFIHPAPILMAPRPPQQTQGLLGWPWKERVSQALLRSAQLCPNGTRQVREHPGPETDLNSLTLPLSHTFNPAHDASGPWIVLLEEPRPH